jgi:glycogen debranching enzyme-like protein
VIVRWRMVGGGAAGLRLNVKPMLTFRPDHAVVSADDPLQASFDIEEGGVRWHSRPDLPAIHARGAFEYHRDPRWRRGIGYAIDRERGEACSDDWWSPGTLSLIVAPNQPAFVTFTIEPGGPDDSQTAFQAELDRRRTNHRAVRPSGDEFYDQLGWPPRRTSLSSTRGRRSAPPSGVVAGGSGTLPGFPAERSGRRPSGISVVRRVDA